MARGECFRKGVRIAYQNGHRVVLGTYNGKAVTAYPTDPDRITSLPPTQVSSGVKASTVVNIIVGGLHAPAEVFAFLVPSLGDCPLGAADCIRQAQSTTWQ